MLQAMLDFFSGEQFRTVVSALNSGFLVTLRLFFVTLVGALPLGLLICASTVLVKQHSILDVFVAIPVSAVLYFIVYHRAFRKKRKHA